MFVVGGNTVGAWVLLVIAIMGWVGMEVVGREQEGHSLEGVGHTAGYARELPMLEVGTLLTHGETDAVSNLCVTD